MTANGLLQIGLYVALLLALVKPLGSYMARVYEGKPFGLDRVLGPIERLIYRLTGVRADEEMDWKAYALAVLLFSAAGLVFLFALERLQGWLPLNPQAFAAVPPDLAWNTAVSFTTNTNWQAYGGETTMSYLTQMLGFTVKNFVSAATGMAILVAFIRGLARRNAKTIGNFWVDLTRTTLYILLPLSLVLALVLVSQGVVQTFSAYKTVPLVEAISGARDAGGKPVTSQVLALGPAASQIAIKHLGTNGGGFFNVNSAHPFESSTPLTDLLEILGETLIAASLCYMFGKMIGDTRQGWAILAAMMVVLVSFQLFAYWAEAKGNPRIAALGVDQTATDLNPGGNMEGKEVRFGIARSALFAAATTATSCGAVNSMHDSFTPLGGLVPLFLMQFSETILGGVGSGLYGMRIFVLVAVFIAGLMVGRTPEYLGKKIESYEIKMASLVVLTMPLVVLLFTAIAVVVEPGVKAIANPGAHGFSEILYTFTSQGNNNGSAFAGISANTPFYNSTGGLAMLFGRFWLAIPTLAIAGSLAKKKHVPAGLGTLPTHTPLFAVLLIGVVVLVGALTFFPALALGPIVEHLQMLAGGK
ncbi:MAG TPA: potassium-transporting ATPase subunit KdpA [Thermoanaerobaculia bacterium]|nr:potassium-transporting ATPase subunit KdpA [Thermoanaerobaculia bacterium]